MTTYLRKPAGRRLGLIPRSLAALVTCGLVLWSASTAFGQQESTDGEIEVTFEAVPLSLEDELADRAGQLIYRGGLELKATVAEFGGLSGLQVDAKGERLLAITDRGSWFTARMAQQRGRLVGLSEAYLQPMLNIAGQSLVSGQNDSEALAYLPGGKGVLVAFENWHRIWAYRGEVNRSFRSVFGSIGVPHVMPAEFRAMPSNGGIEAMATLPDGSLLAISERAKNEAGFNRAWRFSGGAVKELSYRGSDDFDPTDVTVLPSGDLLVLTRRFKRLSGVAVRIERIAAGDLESGVLYGEQIAELKPPLSVDNMEGIAAVAGEGGGIAIYLVSDNNFSNLQRTLLMKFLWKPAGPPA